MLNAFRDAMARSVTDLPGAELLPSRLARSAASVLPVYGAGISLYFSSGRRLPVGASGDVAAAAERLQFTVGEGPCLAAHERGRPVVADEAGLTRQWPAFTAELVARTPVRGIIALQLPGRLRDLGALDLYVVPPGAVGDLGLADCLAVADEVAHVLEGLDGADADHSGGPAWLDAPTAWDRSLVWQAMGVLNACLSLTSADALAVLRAHAYGGGTTVDSLARHVVEGTVPVHDLAPASDTPT
ncbi:MAG: uncharacterized protein JWQ53_420 [Klenkia sp.]|nr:uncharacterized protein [Klenkia sp.]